MSRDFFALLCTTLVLAAPGSAAGEQEKRSSAQRAAFVRANPCPATGLTRGACDGFVVDHVIPLCAGGEDRPSNMQWQSKAEAAAKDREEWRLCRQMKGAKRYQGAEPEM